MNNESSSLSEGPGSQCNEVSRDSRHGSSGPEAPLGVGNIIVCHFDTRHLRKRLLSLPLRNKKRITLALRGGIVSIRPQSVACGVFDLVRGCVGRKSNAVFLRGGERGTEAGGRMSFVSFQVVCLLQKAPTLVQWSTDRNGTPRE
ncbi:hypothetical protein AVEN_42817-1 [Araneus ventricosus]|uniref:Uncharacterized protein n=1 Tax=Araneus ventricosus TaxID=182803 RepID=A0A4Y2AEW6_ARAVE|nr:hypothetical protein AVEN_42817-1 [Araneus ventricosus]